MSTLEDLDAEYARIVKENAVLRERVDAYELRDFWMEYNDNRCLSTFYDGPKLARVVESSSEEVKHLLESHGFSVGEIPDVPFMPNEKGIYEVASLDGSDIDAKNAKVIQSGLDCVKCSRYTRPIYAPVGLRLRAKSMRDEKVIKYKELVDRLERERTERIKEAYERSYGPLPPPMARPHVAGAMPASTFTKWQAPN
jgi:hypothetical protein